MFNDPRIGTAAAGGVCLAIVFLAVHTFTYFSGVEVSADYQSALLTVAVALAGLVVHPAKDDLAALHQLILARLGQPTATRPPVVVSSPLPQPLSAAEMLKASEANR
jgi:hypothetical protein